MPKKMYAIVCFFVLIAFLSGCQDKKDLLIGAWKSAELRGGIGKYDIMVFEKDMMTHHGTRQTTASYKNEGDKVVVHLDRGTLTITFVDDNTTMIETFGMQPTKYVRITVEEAQRINDENNAPRPTSPKMGW